MRSNVSFDLFRTKRSFLVQGLRALDYPSHQLVKWALGRVIYQQYTLSHNVTWMLVIWLVRHKSIPFPHWEVSSWELSKPISSVEKLDNSETRLKAVYHHRNHDFFRPVPLFDSFEPRKHFSLPSQRPCSSTTSSFAAASVIFFSYNGLKGEMGRWIS